MQTNDIFRTSLKAPPHWLRAGAIYMITASTIGHAPILTSETRRKDLLGAFRYASDLYHWTLIAWVILLNHYHIIVQAPVESAVTLPKFVSSIHKFTARLWNDADHTPGRVVWANYWDTCIRSEKDYLQRINYIHYNPVKHGLVGCADEYPFSSYSLYCDEMPLASIDMYQTLDGLAD